MGGDLIPYMKKGREIVGELRVPRKFLEEDIKFLSFYEIQLMKLSFILTYKFNRFEAYIPYSLIGEKLGIKSNNTINRNLKKLLHKGFIIKIEGGCSKKPAKYRIKEEYNQIMKESMENNNDKQAVLEEIQNLRGKGTLKEEEVKSKTKRKTFRDKSIYKWNANDLLSYFADRYKRSVGIPYPSFTGKERKLAKTLLENSEFEILDIIKTVDYYLKNYRDVPGHPKDYPSWSIFWGWRSTIFPMALVGEAPNNKASKNNTREWDETKNNEEWIPTSWD